jgi:hypothetical protein
MQDIRQITEKKTRYIPDSPHKPSDLTLNISEEINKRAGFSGATEALPPNHYSFRISA